MTSAPIVAPHAGAWIETLISRITNAGRSVAPHAGAWIETVSVFGRAPWSASPPRGGVD